MDTQERKVLYYLLLSSVLLAVIFTVFLRNLVRNYWRNQRLQIQVTEVELNTLEKERSRIKSDLHDEIAPLLLSAETMLSGINPADQHDHQRATQALHNLASIRERLQSIAFDLLPASLNRQGLIAAVHELINHMQPCTNCSLYFVHPRTLNLNERMQLHVYRIIKEALHNTIRYAKASHCNVELHIRQHTLQLSVIDDGKGFSLTTVHKSGLNNIALRTELLNGELFINSSQTSGTNISINIPLKKHDYEKTS